MERIQPNEIVNEVKTSNDTTGVTSFVGDTNSTQAVHHENPVPSPMLETLTSVVPDQTIIEFLKRPVRLRTGTITSASTSATLIRAMAAPSEMIYTDPIVIEKVKGFLAFRATMIIRLVVNANRFALGRLRLSFMPGATQAKMYPYNRMVNMMQISALPGVELDIASESEAILRIPFTNPYLFYDLSTSSSNAKDCGAFFLHVYSPIHNGGGNDPTYEIYSHFEDVELNIPAYKFQSAKPKRSFKSYSTNVSDIEATGPITGMANKVSRAARVVKDAGIPIISSLADSVGWFSDLTSGVASIFGWSKPASEQDIIKVVQDPFMDVSTVKGLSSAKKLAYSKENKVVPLQGLSYTDKDETCIKSFATNYAYYEAFTLSTADTHGALKAFYKVNPAQFTSQFSIGGVNTGIFKTPLAFTSTFFQLWRGSIKFRFKVVKSQFHTARIAVVAFPSPSVGNAGSLPGLNSTSYCMREIIDLQLGSEFEIIVPYLSHKPYTFNNEQYSPDQGDTLLAVYVVNPLQAVGDCASTVQVLVEVAGGDDLEYAGTNNNNLRQKQSIIPIIYNSTAFISQSANENKLITSGILGKEKDQLSEASKFSSGENIRSLNALIKVKSRMQSVAGPTVQKITVTPTAVFGGYYDGTAFILNEWSGDLYSYVTSCFAYSRGSVEIAYLDELNLDNTSVSNTIRNTATLTTTIDYSTNYSASSFGGPLSINTSRHNGLHSFVVPPYTGAYARLNRIVAQPTGVVNATALPNDDFTSPYLVYTKFTNDTYVFPMRAAGDDFQLSAFHGIPPFLFV